MPHGPRFERLCREAKLHFDEVSPEEGRTAQDSRAVLVDVREATEFKTKHAVGALHLGQGVVEMKIEHVVPDIGVHIVCYCGGGYRSALVAENLKRMGYEKVSSVRGGFKAWEEAGLPVES